MSETYNKVEKQKVIHDRAHTQTFKQRKPSVIQNHNSKLSN